MPREKVEGGEVEYTGEDRGRKLVSVWGPVTDETLIARFGGTFGGHVFPEEGKRDAEASHVAITPYAE